MIAALQTRTGITLSSSKSAEWRLWTYVIAVCIHSFEIVLDVFKEEVDAQAYRITPGTLVCRNVLPLPGWARTAV